jgi:hypothetical protein
MHYSAAKAVNKGKCAKYEEVELISDNQYKNSQIIKMLSETNSLKFLF